MRKIPISILLISAFLSLNGQSSDSFLKGMALVSHSAYDSSIRYFDLAIEEHPNQVDFRMQRGLAYFNVKQYNAAIEDFLFVNSKQKGRAGFMLAKAESRLHHPEIAIKYLREHLASRYRLSEKDILLDPDMQTLEGRNSWVSLWREKEWYNHYDRQIQEAIYLNSLEKYPDAIGILNDLDKRGYNRSKVKQMKAEIFRMNDNLKGAVKEAELAVKANFRNTDAKKLLIDLYIESEEYQKASDACDKLLILRPESFDYYLVSGKLHSRLNNYSEAIGRLETYLELFPSNANAYAVLGQIHFDKHKYLSALKSMNRALEFDQSKDEYYLLRGKIYAATNTHVFAMKDYSMALDLDPYNGETWLSMGISEMKIGDNSKACFDFKKALQYGNFDARDYIDSICGY